MAGKKWATFAALSVVAAVGVSSMMPTEAAPPSFAKTVNVYVGTQKCDDGGEGSKDKPFCSLRGASQRLEERYQAGEVRGDVYVRLTTDGVHTAKPGYHRFTFAPAAGRRVYLVPEGYTSRAKMKKDAVTYAKIHGNGGQGAENGTGLIVAPSKNRGGSYVISGLEIRGFKNGLFLDGGVNHGVQKPGERLVVHGTQAPITNPIVEYNTFDSIGTKYSKARNSKKKPVDALGVFRPWNTTGAEFSHNVIRNVDGDTHHHVIYGYASTNLKAVANEMSNIVAGATFRYRHGGNWHVADHKLPAGGLVENKYGHVSEWHQSALHEKTRKDNGEAEKLAECNVPDAVTKNMTGWPVVAYKAAPQTACSRADRVFPPAGLVGEQKGAHEYQLTWDAARTLKDEATIKEYKIVVNGTVVDKVPADKRSFTITQQVLREAGASITKEFTYAVVAVSSTGSESAPTANLSAGWIDRRYVSSGQNRVGTVDTIERLADVQLGATNPYTPAPRMADSLELEYRELAVKPGGTLKLYPYTHKNGASRAFVPEGTTFTVSAEGINARIFTNVGTVTVTAPANAKPGVAKVTVTATYPDGSKAVRTVPVTIKR